MTWAQQKKQAVAWAEGLLLSAPTELPYPLNEIQEERIRLIPAIIKTTIKAASSFLTPEGTEEIKVKLADMKRTEQMLLQGLRSSGAFVTFRIEGATYEIYNTQPALKLFIKNWNRR